MKPRIIVVLAAIGLTCLWCAKAQNYDTNGAFVQTFVGSGFYGLVDGVGVNTMFYNPNAVVADSQGNLFVWDSSNFRIRRIAPNGTVTTFAGGGLQNTGIGTNVTFSGFFGPVAMTIDRSNALRMALGTYLYTINSSAIVSRTELYFLSPYGSPYLKGICADSAGNIYLSSDSENRIYRYSTNGILDVFAGSGNPGYADGNGIFTAFNHPAGLAADAADNLYVWDSGNNLIRRIDQDQNVTTIAGVFQQSWNADGIGNNASFNSVYQMGFDNAGNLYLACGNCIRRMDAMTNVTTIAGSFFQIGYTNGPGNLARFGDAEGVCVSRGTLYVADSTNQRIRSITNNPTPQVVSSGDLQLNIYPGLQITGTVGRAYQIQASPDMNTWTTIATVLLGSSPYLWIDPAPANDRKFFRALLMP